MADRPIIFSAPMVRALLEGRKTQTRRLLKPQPGELDSVFRDNAGLWHVTDSNGAHMSELRIPYAPSDRLYVREAFVSGFDIDDEYCRPVGDKKVWYRATDSNLTWFDPDTDTTLDNPPWKPSIHMPRWASRITLEVTEVRVERLQDCSEADAVAEGVAEVSDQWRDGDEPADFPSYKAYGQDACFSGHMAARMSFMTLWNSLHGPDAWAENPWVVAVSFTVEQRNIDAGETT